MTQAPDAVVAAATALVFPDVDLQQLTEHDRAVYEAGFLMGFAVREPELERAERDADRYYALAYDRRRLCSHCGARIRQP